MNVTQEVNAYIDRMAPAEDYNLITDSARRELLRTRDALNKALYYLRRTRVHSTVTPQECWLPGDPE